jgi:hypothetical protein
LQSIGLNKLREEHYSEYQPEKKQQFLRNLGG